MNEEQPPVEKPVEVPVVDVKQGEKHHSEPQPQDPRRRLRELLAIPDRDRTDAIWDEIVELEIQSSPGNRAQQPQANAGQQRQEPGRQRDQSRRQNPQPNAKSGKRFFDKRRRGPGKPT